MDWIEDFESISTAFVNFSECSVSWFSAVCMALISLFNTDGEKICDFVL